MLAMRRNVRLVTEVITVYCT